MMSQPKRQNLTINGSGSSGGGIFNKVKIRGEGTIIDDFDCQEFYSHGTCELLGNVKMNRMNVFGSGEVRKNITGNEVKVTGTLNIGGSVKIKSAKIRGNVDVAGKVVLEDADIKGGLHVKGDCEVESFKITGIFDINGLLNAGVIDASLKFATSQAKEIGGEKITIRKNKSIFNFIHNQGELYADIIEGDDIYLEYTKANIVRGNNIEIGPNCEIELVEYQTSFKKANETIVKEFKKV